MKNLKILLILIAWAMIVFGIMFIILVLLPSNNNVDKPIKKTFKPADVDFLRYCYDPAPDPIPEEPCND